MPQAAIVLAVVAAVAAKKESDAAARQLKFEAKIANDLAKREKQQGRAQAANFRRKQSRLLARSRALRAGAGLALGSGSPLLVDADTAAEIELGAQTILANSSRRVFDFRLQRNLARVAAKNKRAAAPMESAQAGGTTFLNAGGSFGGSSTGTGTVANPGPGLGGPAASSPAGGAQATGGHAPTT